MIARLRAVVSSRVGSLWGRRWLRRSVVACVALVGLLLLGSVAVNAYVVRFADDHRYTEVADVPERPVALVLGAGVNGSNPTPALASRLDGAIELYRSGRVDHLLMSGDNSRSDYDEVTVMRDYAIARGVPGDAITRDYAGFDTYDSCYRAREVFGVTGAVVVTQDFHLARAVYTCRELGIDAVGLAIPDWHFRPGDLDYRYTRSQEVGYSVREWFARVKATVELNVTHPEPVHLGPYEGLTET